MSERHSSSHYDPSVRASGILCGDWGIPERETGIALRTLDLVASDLAVRGAQLLYDPGTERYLLSCALGVLALSRTQLRRLQEAEGLILGQHISWSAAVPASSGTIGWACVTPVCGLARAWTFRASWVNADIVPLEQPASEPAVPPAATGRSLWRTQGASLSRARLRLCLTQRSAAAGSVESARCRLTRRADWKRW